MKTYLRIIFSSLIALLFMPAMAMSDKPVTYDSLIKANSDKSLDRLTVLGYKSLEQGNYDEALMLYTIVTAKGDDSMQGTERREFIKALNNIGYIYLFDRSNPEKAYPYLLHAQRLAESSREDDLLGAILDNMAKVHDDFGDPEKAIELYNLAMEHVIKVNTEVSPFIQLMVFNDMINCAVAHDMIDSISRSLEMFDNLPVYSIPMGRYTKAMCEGLRLLSEKDMAEATSIIKNAGKYINSKLDSARYVTDHNLTIANVYHMREMEDSARTFLNLALDNATRHQIPDRLPRIYRGMAIVATTRGDSSESRRMRLLAYEADETLHSSKIYASLNTLEASQQIEGLNLRLREADIKHGHRVTVIWILGVAMILIGGLLAMIVIRNRKLTSSLKELVTRHREAMNAGEANERLRKKYEDTISNLQTELKKYSPLPNASENVTDKGITLPVDENERLRIIGEANDIFRDSQEIYEPDFSLERLAELTDTKPRYLSALLNDTLGKSFSVLLAEARVKYACTILLSPDFKKTKTIESIAIEVGYKSRTHFTSVFKKITGVTPLQYVAMAT